MEKKIELHLINGPKLNDDVFVCRAQNANWDRECGRPPNGIYYSVRLERWMIMCPRSIERDVRLFYARLQQFSANMNFDVREPRL